MVPPRTPADQRGYAMMSVCGPVAVDSSDMLPSLDSLQCFERAARLLNFRQAARAVSLTPAAFGQRIQKLEDQMGVKLFVRTTRSVHLTEAGAALLEPAERCLRLAEETMRVARGESMPPPMDLTLGTRHELGLSWICPSSIVSRRRGLGCSCICTSDRVPISSCVSEPWRWIAR